MDALEQLIQNEVEKEIANSVIISSLPAKVVADLGNEFYTVELITSKSKFNLANFSGSSLNINENVQIFYRGGSISSKSAFIGASLNKSDSNRIRYFYGTDKTNLSIETASSVSEILFENKDETTINLVFNAVLSSEEGGDYTFTIYVDNVLQDFSVMGTIAADGYDNCSFTIPIEIFDSGMHLVRIAGVGNCTVVQSKAYIFGQGLQSSVYFVTNEDDYVYKLNSTNSDTIYYKSSYNYILMPSAFEELPLNIVGVTTFSDSNVEGVIIPEGVTIIE